MHRYILCNPHKSTASRPAGDLNAQLRLAAFQPRSAYPVAAGLALLATLAPTPAALQVVLVALGPGAAQLVLQAARLAPHGLGVAHQTLPLARFTAARVPLKSAIIALPLQAVEPGEALVTLAAVVIVLAPATVRNLAQIAALLSDGAALCALPQNTVVVVLAILHRRGPTALVTCSIALQTGPFEAAGAGEALVRGVIGIRVIIVVVVREKVGQLAAPLRVFTAWEGFIRGALSLDAVATPAALRWFRVISTGLVAPAAP